MTQALRFSFSERLGLPQPTQPVLLSLWLASVAGFGLLLARVAVSGQLKLAFLVWNLFLAWMPLVFSLLAWRAYHQPAGSRWRSGVWSFLWFIFLPNAPYIITDLVHLHPRPPIPIWVDMMAIVFFAWIGLLLGFVSLYLMQQIVAERFGRAGGWIFASAVLALTGLGIYIGRFLRWNSWDLFLNPIDLAVDLARQFSHPRTNPGPFLYSALFAKVCLLGYAMFYPLTHLRLAHERRAAGVVAD